MHAQPTLSCSISPFIPLATGFSADDGASLLVAFRGLQAESIVQGQAHKTIAQELDNLVASPFDEWAQGYSVSRTISCVPSSLTPVSGATLAKQDSTHGRPTQVL